jgi:hypothetical protein
MRYPDEFFYQQLGLIRLPLLQKNLPWAKAWRSVREPDALAAHVRFDERDVKTEHGQDNEAPANERAGYR